MTPAPFDPIRPVGRVEGDLWVGPSELPERVHRRERHPEEECGEQHRRHRREQAEETTAGPWRGQDEPAREAGVYDDHGHTGSGPDDSRPHIDTSA